MLFQAYSGRLSYFPDRVAGPFKLLVAVPCLIGESYDPVDALLDTAAEWCVISSTAFPEFGELESTANSDSKLATRFGVLSGRIERCPLTLIAEEGETLTIDATWFVSDDWIGPAVIGWRGALERIRFGLDPSDETFCFAAL